MEDVLAWVEGLRLVQYLRFGKWGYAVVNTSHVFGIALLVGAILPLDLRLMGAWRLTPRRELARVLVPVAATGLAIAVTAGVLLFSVKARDYVDHELMQLKLVLVAVGASAAILLHARFGWLMEGASDRRLAVHGALSLACWTGALVCGRLIAFFD
ncbi:MAG TPA: DUF2214 domain-containing protein [Thermohalobaculum sp.]|nr:DUF2214 domain-containing protein [Thermohalobaculum sp.]